MEKQAAQGSLLHANLQRSPGGRPEPDLLLAELAAERTIRSAGGGVGCRGRGTLCPQDPPAAAALLRPRPGVARDTALCGPLEGAAPANPPPGRAGVVAARLRVSRARRRAQRRCLGPGAGRRRDEGGGTKGWVPAGRHLAKTRPRVGGLTCRPEEKEEVEPGPGPARPRGTLA